MFLKNKLFFTKKFNRVNNTFNTLKKTDMLRIIMKSRSFNSIKTTTVMQEELCGFLVYFFSDTGIILNLQVDQH